MSVLVTARGFNARQAQELHRKETYQKLFSHQEAMYSTTMVLVYD
jgi:hypothetical protein